MNRNLALQHAGFGRLELITQAALGLLRPLWQGLLNAHRAWSAARARDELHQLSDRTLKDIGLSRSEIDSLFR